jgi:hypothetical protein
MDRRELFEAIGKAQIEHNIMILKTNGTDNTITFTIGWEEEFKITYRPKTILLEHTTPASKDGKIPKKVDKKQFDLDEKDLFNKIFEFKSQN